MEGDRAAHWLVALINPDFFATQHSLVASGSNVQVLISDLRGQVISAAGDVRPSARGIESLPPFTLYLPQREHGEYLGAGSDGADAVAAFRVSRQWPLLILAEEPQREVMAVWRARAGGAAVDRPRRGRPAGRAGLGHRPQPAARAGSHRSAPSG